MSQTVAQVIVQCLEEKGVESVFGMPGSQNLEIYNSLADSKIKSILVTNELFASFIASGYSWSSDKIGVCLPIPGPGLTNMITGLASALVDSIPLLVLVPSIKSHNKSFYLHEINQKDLITPIVKKFYSIDNPEETKKIISDAMSLAKEGDPGPVVVEIPRKLLTEEVTSSITSEEVSSRPEINPPDIQKILDLVKQSQNCRIYIGKGCLDASAEIIELAETLGAPVATTISGIGIIPDDHPLSVGFGFGPSGTEIAEQVFQTCDTLIAIGCKFSEMATGKWGLNLPKNLIHVDINQDVFNKNYKSFISIKADAKDFLEKLLDCKTEIAKETDQTLVTEIAKGKQLYKERMEKVETLDYVHPGKFYYSLRQKLERDGILTVDCGYHQLWALTNFSAYAPRKFISSTDYQAMGFAVPTAIGAKIANPSCQVACVCGDGGFLISGFELLTAKKQGVNIKVFIFNDGELGLMKFLQQEKYKRLNSTVLQNPDFEEFAKSIGVTYACINDTDELSEKMNSIFSTDELMLIDVRVKYEEKPRYYQGLVKTIWKNMSSEEKIQLTRQAIGRKNSG